MCSLYTIFIFNTTVELRFFGRKWSRKHITNLQNWSSFIMNQRKKKIIIKDHFFLHQSNHQSCSTEANFLHLTGKFTACSMGWGVTRLSVNPHLSAIEIMVFLTRHLRFALKRQLSELRQVSQKKSTNTRSYFINFHNKNTKLIRNGLLWGCF